MNLQATTATCLFMLLFYNSCNADQNVLLDKINNLTDQIGKAFSAIQGVKVGILEDIKKTSTADNGGHTYFINPGLKKRDQQLGTEGSKDKPFITISQCVKQGLQPGDQCLVTKGAYDEVIEIKNIHGTADQPILIGGTADQRPVLGGTEVVQVERWESSDGKIYKGKVLNKSPIWQLFINGQMMTNARWPNAKWSDRAIFNGSFWSKIDSGWKPSEKDAEQESKKDGATRKVVDSNLQELSGKQIDGAMAILNIGSFNTFVGKVENFQQGGSNDSSFKFKDTFGNYHFKRKNCRYFLEDKLDLLDEPEEWFYDKESKMLYVYPSPGTNLTTSKILGKTKTYALSIKKSSNVIIKNLDFFATTLIIEDSDAVTIDSCNFMFPSYSKRMLGDTGLIKWTKVVGNSEDAKFINNKFIGSDGTALYGGKKATNMIIRNNLFEYNDWTGANMVTAMGGMSTVKTDGPFTLMERNTLNYNGASVGLRPGLNSTITMNRIKKQCWGVIQNDGAGIQLQRKPQTNSQITFNWVYDSPKYGLRYDGELPKIGKHGNMSFNVVWKCNGIMVKGDEHKVLNNLAFDKRNAKDSDGQGTGCMMCVIKKLRKKPGIMNNNTIVSNNIADVANGGVNVVNRKVPLGFSAVLKNNLFNEDFKPDDFVDLQNFDFRPRKGSSPDINKVGPYTSDSNIYWIPGREMDIPSFPIPPNRTDGTESESKKRVDVLIWQNAYQCKEHRVYFGKDPDKLEYIGKTEGESNVFPVPNPVEKSTTYFWRVDAVPVDTKSGKESSKSSGSTVKAGDVQSFDTVNSTKRNPNKDSHVIADKRTQDKDGGDIIKGSVWQFKTRG